MKADEISLVWIDDNNDRKKDAFEIEKLNNKIKTNFIHPKTFQKGICDKTGTIVDVDLFLVDYALSKKDCSSEFYLGEGLSLIGLIRENYPDVPVYLYSGDDKSVIFERLEYTARKEAEKVLPLKVIQDSGPNFLYMDALDYRKIRNTLLKGDAGKLIDLLLPPEDEKNTIKYVVPTELKIDGMKPAGKSTSFASWVRQVFMKNPGFIYDSLYAATKLGMKKEAFLKKEKEFKAALYSGLFAKTIGQQFWWKSLLYDLVFKKDEAKEATTDVREISKKVFGLTDDETAKCAVCTEPFPDTVGIDSTTGDREPVHLRCSRSDPKYTRLLYFDETRLFSKEENK